MITKSKDHTKKFCKEFQRLEDMKFTSKYSIDTCELPGDPNACLVLQSDQNSEDINMITLNRLGAEVFSVLSPIDDNVVRQYKSTSKYKSERNSMLKAIMLDKER